MKWIVIRYKYVQILVLRSIFFSLTSINFVFKVKNGQNLGYQVDVMSKLVKYWFTRSKYVQILVFVQKFQFYVKKYVKFSSKYYFFRSKLSLKNLQFLVEKRITSSKNLQFLVEKRIAIDNWIKVDAFIRMKTGYSSRGSIKEELIESIDILGNRICCRGSPPAYET